MATVLASQVFPTSPFSAHSQTDERVQYRPAKNLEAFNSLLPPAVEFVEGSSSGTLAVAEGKYEPINGSPKPSRESLDSHKKSSTIRTKQLGPDNSVSQEAPRATSQLYNHPIYTSWPSNVNFGVGFFNTGNTCFLNSALQCLLHTPPLLHILLEHNNHSEQCRIPKANFCMSCSMRQLMMESFKRSKPFTPWPVTKNIHYIAKHMRKGRQEDSHEFLRYAIDALQKSCLAGYPPKLDHKIAETTWVHKLFGGRLRSRVTCTMCGHNSDTFDSILDLSIDIHGQASLKEALKKFTAIDHLRGADKYKCEKCKKPVNAEKRFTLHDAPTILTVHLKRFTPMGRKLAHAIRYDEHLSLQSCMSEGQYGPTYSLYAVISHAGGGPNSGHYYAHVKDSRGQWHEMNDEMVSRSSVPIGMKSAYILFYIKNKGQALEEALDPSRIADHQSNVLHKKRKTIYSDDEKEDIPEHINGNGSTFIGPRLPTPRPSISYPEAESLKRKIEAAEQKKTTQPLANRAPLVDYADEEEEEEGEVIQNPDTALKGLSVSSSPIRPPPSSPLPPSSPADPIATSSFYGGQEPESDSTKKRKVRESEEKNGPLENLSSPPDSTEQSSKLWKRPPEYVSGSTSSKSTSVSSAMRNPFSGITGGNNFTSKRDDLLFRPRKLQRQYGGKKQRMLM